MYMDNQSALGIIANPLLHGRTKHIDIVYMLIRNMRERGEIESVYVKSDDQIADVLTKALSREKLRKFRMKMMVDKVGVKLTKLEALMVIGLCFLSGFSSHPIKKKHELLLDIDYPCQHLPRSWQGLGWLSMRKDNNDEMNHIARKFAIIISAIGLTQNWK